MPTAFSVLLFSYPKSRQTWATRKHTTNPITSGNNAGEYSESNDRVDHLETWCQLNVVAAKSNVVFDYVKPDVPRVPHAPVLYLCPSAV